MKQFIYLDTDIVNSILAQKDKGLVLETASEQENTTGKENSKTGTIMLDSSVGGSIWKFAQAQAEFSGTGELSNSKHSQTVLKEIATKTLHDAAFDIAYEHIQNEHMSNFTNVHLGSFIELKQNFEFVDLVYIEKLFSDSKFINFIKKTENERIENQAYEEFNSLNREERRGNETELKKQIKKLIEENNKNYDNIAEMVTAFRYMLPYNRLLVSSEGYIIPLEDKYFRDNPETIGFKHGGGLTCVGYITNIIQENSPVSQNIFSKLQMIINKTLISLLSSNTQKLIIVNPIAIYYGK